ASARVRHNRVTLWSLAMQSRARRTPIQRSFSVGWVLLFAVLGAHACIKSNCEDTGSCGEFTPAPGCGWVLANGDVVHSTAEMKALGATWTSDEGWNLPNGSIPKYRCSISSADGGPVGNGGNGGGNGMLDGSQGNGG